MKVTNEIKENIAEENMIVLTCVVLQSSTDESADFNCRYIHTLELVYGWSLYETDRVLDGEILNSMEMKNYVYWNLWKEGDFSFKKNN